MIDDARQLIDQLVARWNNKAPETFGALFTDDAIFIDVVGNTMVGPAGIGEGHALPWSTILRDATLTADDVTIRNVSKDVVSAEVRWTSSGHRSPDGNELPPRKGVMLVVMAAKGGTLKIAQVCNADHTPTYDKGDDLPGGPPA